MKSETLSLRTMNDELVFLLGLLLFNETLEKKDLLFLANKLI